MSINKSKSIFTFIMALLMCFSIIQCYSNGNQQFAPIVAGHAANNDPLDIFDVIDENNMTIDEDKMDTSWKPTSLVDKAQSIARIIFSICTVISLIFLIINITKLAGSGSNDQARQKATMGILWSGVALALTGGMTIIVSFFWNFFDNV